MIAHLLNEVAKEVETNLDQLSSISIDSDITNNKSIEN